MDNLKTIKTIRKGDKNEDVKVAQEWFSLNGYGLVMDGEFGSATDFAAHNFQKEHGLVVDGIVGKQTIAQLFKPASNTLKKLYPEKQLGTMIVKYAQQHLVSNPREIGGQNMGPWVRLYMKGNDGTQYPWCAGFACFVLKQACDSLEIPVPIKESFSCDQLAQSATENNLFLPEKNLDRSKIKPGMFFLSRKSANDWTHMGIVIDATPKVLLTIEGNTNDEGNREGYEVCRRIRNYEKKDFIAIA